MSDWWRLFFQPDRFPIDTLMEPAHTEAELAALLPLLPPPPCRVLDVACGTGRHSVGLARKGYAVAGADQSRPYLELARRRAARGRAGAVFFRRDMRRLGFEGRFDAAVNLWTSFGYFASPKDDVAALRSILRALKPGGRLVLELINGEVVRRSFRPRNWTRAGKGWFLEEAELLEGKDPAVESRWTFVRPDGRSRSTRTRIRLYDARRLRGALESAGFERVRLRAGLLEEARGGGRVRLLAIAHRPLAGRSPRFELPAIDGAIGRAGLAGRSPAVPAIDGAIGRAGRG